MQQVSVGRETTEALGLSWWDGCELVAPEQRAGVCACLATRLVRALQLSLVLCAIVLASMPAVRAAATLDHAWDFRGGSGNTIVDSVGSVVATLKQGNGGALPTRSASGVVMVGTGPTRSSSNSGGYVDLNLDGVVLGGAMTIELLYAWNAFNFHSSIFTCGRPGGTYVFRVLNMHTARVLTYMVVGQTNPPRKQTPSDDADVTLGTRHHIVATVAGATMRLYIDGALKGEKTTGWEPTSMTRSDCSIGKSPSSTNGYLNGTVSSLKLYSGAMTQADVLAAYIAHLPACAQGGSASICAMRSTNALCTTSASSCCAGAATSIFVDATVATIPVNAFTGCASLRFLSLVGATHPLASIGADAFAGTAVNAFGVTFGSLSCATLTSGGKAFDFTCEASKAILAFAWDFRGGSGITIVDSVGGVVATLKQGNGGDFPTRSATGVVMVGTGPTESSSNAGGYIDVNLDAVVFGGAMTIEVVVVWNAFNYQSRAFDCGNWQGSDNIVLGNNGPTGELRWRVLKGGRTKYINSGSTSDLTLGMRHHIVTTVVGTTMRSYIDGVLKGTKTDGWDPTSMTRSTCYIGKSNWANESYLSGKVSSLKLYSGAMTQAEVSAMCFGAQVCTVSPTASPTTSPTTAPTSALDACFATRAATPIDLPEYAGSRPDTIVINSRSAAACFSGTSATTVTIACETTALRASVTPATAQIAASDPFPLATFSVAVTADATNDGPSVPFTVRCRVKETSDKGTILFRGNVLAVQQPSIGGFCLEFTEGCCAAAGAAAIVPSIASSGLNNVTLYAADVLPGLTFDTTTAVLIRGVRCDVTSVGSDGRSIVFVTPPIEVVGEGYQEIVLHNDASSETAAGTLCWGARCERDWCGSDNGALCPALPVEQRGIFFTKTCVGINRMGVQFPPPTDPRCVSENENEAAEQCSWGWGQSCRQCPVGCRCPGGPRCWVRSGYWAAAEDSSIDPLPCTPAAEASTRCLGFDPNTGQMACGLNHAGFLCEGCRVGFYRAGGDCEECPSTEIAQAIAVPALANGAVAVGLFTSLLAVTYLLLRAGIHLLQPKGSVQASVGETLKEAALAAFSVTVYSIKTLQMVALSVKGARNPLPSFFKTVVSITGVVLLTLPEVRFECLGKAGAYWGDVSVMSMYSACAALHFALSLRYVFPTKCLSIDGSASDEAAGNGDVEATGQREAAGDASDDAASEAEGGASDDAEDEAESEATDEAGQAAGGADDDAADEAEDEAEDEAADDAENDVVVEREGRRIRVFTPPSEPHPDRVRAEMVFEPPAELHPFDQLVLEIMSNTWVPPDDSPAREVATCADLLRTAARLAATKVHPYSMMGSSMLLFILDPIIVTRVLRVLHCIETHFGWRLKANVDFVCYDSEHSRAVAVASIALAVACASFCWRVVQVWWVFVRRAPRRLGDSDGAQGEVDATTAGAAPAAESREEGAGAGELSAAAPRTSRIAARSKAALYELGLDWQSAIERFARCRDAGLPAPSRNVELRIVEDAADSKIVAFGNLVDAGVKPHLFWFLPLQSAVNSLLSVIDGVFGGSQASSVQGAASAPFLAPALSIVVLLAFGATAAALWPFRRRPRDAWKIYVLLGSVGVSLLSQSLSFALTLRTGSDSEESTAFGTFCVGLAYAVVASCAALCAALLIAYFSALEGPRLVCKLFALLRSSAVEFMRAKCYPPAAAYDGAEVRGFELAPLPDDIYSPEPNGPPPEVGGMTLAAYQASMDTTNPLHRAHEPLDNPRPSHVRGPPLRFNPDDIYPPEPDGPPSNVGGVTLAADQASMDTTNPLHRAHEPLDNPSPSHERAPPPRLALYNGGFGGALYNGGFEL
jgi:hypothetical protein